MSYRLLFIRATLLCFIVINDVFALEIATFYPFQLGMSLSQVKDATESSSGVLSASRSNPSAPTFIGKWRNENRALEKDMIFIFNEKNKLYKVSRYELESSFELFYDHIENVTMKYGKPDIGIKTVVTDMGRHRNFVATWCIEKQELVASKTLAQDGLIWQLKLGCVKQ